MHVVLLLSALLELLTLLALVVLHFMETPSVWWIAGIHVFKSNIEIQVYNSLYKLFKMRLGTVFDVKSGVQVCVCRLLGCLVAWLLGCLVA